MTELIPLKDSEEVGQAIAVLLEEILKYREGIKFAERCVRFYQLRRNKHWKNKSTSTKLISANLLGSHHQKTVNMLTDNNPTFNAVQAGELEDDGVEKLSMLVKTIDSWWIDTEQQHIFEESTHIGELYGTVGEFMSFDDEVNFPEGEVETESLDPLYYSLYPPKVRTVKKSGAFLRWYPMTVREARRKWPESAEVIEGDMSLLEDIGDTREDEQGKPSTKQTILNGLTRWLSGDQPERDDTDELFVIEAWVKDRSEKDGEPVYPGGIRRVIVCNAGDVVLSDDYNPSINHTLPEEILQKQYLYSRFPVSHNQSVTDPTSPFGMADFEQLEQLNIEVNKTLSQFTMFKDKASRVKIVNPKDSGVRNDELDNRNGILSPTNHLVASAIQYIQPPQMGNDIPAALGMYKDFFNEVAGSFNDVMQGQKAGSEVVAAKAIAMLLEEASRMVRGKTRNYSKMLRERGRMYLSLAQSWYDTDRYITFQRQGKEVTQPINREVLQIPGKINVVSGSTMPVSLIQKREESMSLAKMGMIDQEEVLKSFDWNNYKDVIKRMQQGPIGEFVQKLGAIGIPQQLLQMFQQIAQMDMKEVEKAVKEGKIPPFQQVMQQMSGQQQPPPPDPQMMKIQSDAQISSQKLEIENKKVQIDATKAQAEIEKIMVEAELVKQKIETEITERAIKVEGLKLDIENIKIKKATAVTDIKNSIKDREIEEVKTASGLMSEDHKENMDREKVTVKSAGTYNEKGEIKSNNQEIE